ncbi:WD40 repeat domain-containing protein [Streptomyces avermitilis]|uniref:WD40 repeat domain-containing protein n=1 Tax=Streptomyces avermitilis TaxID=33903 RepID=UPI0033B5981B
MSEARSWDSPDDAHRLIAKALAELVAEDPTIPPHPYLSRHLAQHAARGRVLDDTHVPLAILPWESSRNVRILLRQTGATQQQAWLEAWAGIEPFVRDADPDSRLTSLHLAHHTATCRRLSLTARPVSERRLAGSRITPLWSDWTAPDNVLAVSDTLVESLAHTTTATGRTLLISGDSHGTIRMWEANGTPAGAPLHTHGGAVQHLLPLPDDLLVSGGTDGAVRVWHSTRGQQLVEPVRRPRTWVSALALFEPADGARFLLVAHSDGHLTALDPVTFEPADTPLPDLDPAPALLTPLGPAEADGSTALVIAQGRRVVVWRPGRGVVHTSEHQGEVRAVVDLPSGGRYAVCDDSGYLGFWDVSTGHETVAAGPAHDGPVIALTTLAVDGRQAVISAGLDHTLRVWDADTGRPVGGALEGHTDPPVALTTLPGEGQELVVSAAADHTLRRWKLAGHGTRPGRPVRRPVTAAALPGPTVVPAPLAAVADGAGTALWNVRTGRHVSLPPGVPPVTAFAWATVYGDPVLLSAHSDAAVRLWSLYAGNAVTPSLRGTLLNHSLPVHAMTAFPHAGATLLATGGADGSVRLWHLGDRLELAHWNDHALSVRDLTLLGTGEDVLIVSAGSDGTVRLWDPGTRQASGGPVHCGQQVVHAVTTVARRPDEAGLIASGGEDGTVRLWDPATRGPVGDPLDARDGAVTALASFHTPAGRPCLAAAGPSGTIHLWDVAARTHLLRIVTGNPLSTLAARQAGEPFTEHPVLLAAGTAGVCMFDVRLERLL